MVCTIEQVPSIPTLHSAQAGLDPERADNISRLPHTWAIRGDRQWLLPRPQQQEQLSEYPRWTTRDTLSQSAPATFQQLPLGSRDHRVDPGPSGSFLSDPSHEPLNTNLQMAKVSRGNRLTWPAVRKQSENMFHGAHPQRQDPETGTSSSAASEDPGSS